MLDVEFCRDQFPPLARELVYFENAGGSYVPQSVIDRMTDYMRETQMQPCWSYPESSEAGARIDRGTRMMADLLNAEPDEIVIGPSTTLNVIVLSQALRPLWEEGDEIIVTNQDHEANSGAWRRLADTGVVVREWKVDPHTGELNTDDLRSLLNDRTRLVCCPHVSNIVGTLNPIADITKIAHAAGALVCIDGVAAVAHTLPDVRAIDCDIYLFSTYKLYGPHLAALYVRKELIERATNQNHFFHAASIPAKLNPGGTNYESAAGLEGIGQYLDAVHAHHFDNGEKFPVRARQVFELFREQEASLMTPLLEYLNARERIRVIGSLEADPTRRAPTFSFAIEGHSSQTLAHDLGARGFAVGHGHFYAHRCVEALGVDPDDGFVRASMTHYNTVAEIEQFVQCLDQLI